MITKRDRHGRIIDSDDNTIETAADFEETRQQRWLFPLDRIAKQVFLDRNAQGAEPRHRATVKIKMRPYLARALEHAALARTAILAGDTLRYELELARANHMRMTAQVEFRQPFMEAAAKSYRSKGGGRPSGAAKAAAWAAEVADRKRRSSILTMREIYEDIADRERCKWTWVRDRVSSHNRRK